MRGAAHPGPPWPQPASTGRGLKTQTNKTCRCDSALSISLLRLSPQGGGIYYKFVQGAEHALFEPPAGDRTPFESPLCLSVPPKPNPHPSPIHPQPNPGGSPARRLTALTTYGSTLLCFAMAGTAAVGVVQLALARQKLAAVLPVPGLGRPIAYVAGGPAHPPMFWGWLGKRGGHGTGGTWQRRRCRWSGCQGCWGAVTSRRPSPSSTSSRSARYDCKRLWTARGEKGTHSQAERTAPKEGMSQS